MNYVTIRFKNYEFNSENGIYYETQFEDRRNLSI